MTGLWHLLHRCPAVEKNAADPKLKDTRWIMTMKYSALALSALAASAIAAPAFAEDGKAMPGAVCQATFEVVADSLSRSSGTLSSLAAGTVSATCPVAKDIEAGRIVRATIKVIDRNPTQEFACTLMTLRSDGTILQSQTVLSNGSSNLPQTLSFGAQGTANGGAYNLECVIPGRVASLGTSTLLTYNVVEN
jgi:hypothetical protein